MRERATLRLLYLLCAGCMFYESASRPAGEQTVRLLCAFARCARRPKATQSSVGRTAGGRTALPMFFVNISPEWAPTAGPQQPPQPLPQPPLLPIDGRQVLAAEVSRSAAPHCLLACK